MLLVVACALVDADRRVLLAQRPPGKAMAGLWEFPGGKVGAGETPEAAIIRELQEELGIETKSACLAPLTFASHTYEHFHLLMPLFICRRWWGTPRGMEDQALKWVRPQALARLSHARRRCAARGGVAGRSALICARPLTAFLPCDETLGALAASVPASERVRGNDL